MKWYPTICLLAIAIVMSSCHSKTVATDPVVENETPIVGNDRDEHGCIGSAGYRWSEVKGECIRLFEVGIMLTDVQHPNSTDVAYLVLDQDQMLAEIFLSSRDAGLVLRQQGGDWENEDYTLKMPLPDIFELYDVQGVLLYKRIIP